MEVEELGLVSGLSAKGVVEGELRLELVHGGGDVLEAGLVDEVLVGEGGDEGLGVGRGLVCYVDAFAPELPCPLHLRQLLPLLFLAFVH